MTRLRKVFDCDTAVYLDAKRKAETEGIYLSRFVERAIQKGLRHNEENEEQRNKRPLMFLCDAELYSRAKEQARKEGVYLARWLEDRLGRV